MSLALKQVQTFVPKKSYVELVYERPSDPMDRFTQWFEEAALHPQIIEAHSVNLATVSPSGRPSNRMVTMRCYDTSGFVFLTHKQSHKGTDISSNPNVSLCFFWEAMRKQVRVEGQVKPLNCREADWHFSRQPLEHKVRAWSSAQSQSLENLDALKQSVLHNTHALRHHHLPRPEAWSGYRVIPNMIEFFEGDNDGIDYRECFKRTNSVDWTRALLAP